MKDFKFEKIEVGDTVKFEAEPQNIRTGVVIGINDEDARIKPEDSVVTWSVRVRDLTLVKKAAAETNKVDKSKWGVHEAHCCYIHGCKYGDPDCPVANGLTKQRFLCMDCTDTEDEPYTLEEIEELRKANAYRPTFAELKTIYKELKNDYEKLRDASCAIYCALADILERQSPEHVPSRIDQLTGKYLAEYADVWHACKLKDTKSNKGEK